MLDIFTCGLLWQVFDLFNISSSNSSCWWFDSSECLWTRGSNNIPWSATIWSHGTVVQAIEMSNSRWWSGSQVVWLRFTIILRWAHVLNEFSNDSGPKVGYVWVEKYTWNGKGPKSFLISTFGKVIFFGGGIEKSIKSLSFLISGFWFAAFAAAIALSCCSLSKLMMSYWNFYFQSNSAKIAKPLSLQHNHIVVCQSIYQLANRKLYHCQPWCKKPCALRRITNDKTTTKKPLWYLTRKNDHNLNDDLKSEPCPWRFLNNFAPRPSAWIFCSGLLGVFDRIIGSWYSEEFNEILPFLDKI